MLASLSISERWLACKVMRPCEVSKSPMPNSVFSEEVGRGGGGGGERHKKQNEFVKKRGDRWNRLYTLKYFFNMELVICTNLCGFYPILYIPRLFSPRHSYYKSNCSNYLSHLGKNLMEHHYFLLSNVPWFFFNGNTVQRKGLLVIELPTFRWDIALFIPKEEQGETVS